MATIEERKQKRGTVYRVKVRLAGLPHQDATFDRKSDAVRWAEDVEHALLKGLLLPGQDIPADDKTILAAVVDYLAIKEKDLRRSRHTILSDRDTGKRLIAHFGGLTLRTLKKEDIEEYKDARLQEVGPSSVRLDLSMLSRLYETARITWRIEGLEYPGKDIKRPAPPPERKTILQESQFPLLLDACRASKNRMLYPLIFLLINTGMRPEEAVLLRWKAVNLDGGFLDLTKTKTDPRRVPLSIPCVEMLGTLPGTDDPASLVFISEQTARKDKPVTFFRRSFELACIRAGINAPTKRDTKKANQEGRDANRVTLYTLRHCAATYLIMAGVDLRTVADILGHKNISMTMKYTHIADAHKKKAVDSKGLPWHDTSNA